MKQSRFTEERIIAVLREHEAGVKADEASLLKLHKEANALDASNERSTWFSAARWKIVSIASPAAQKALAKYLGPTSHAEFSLIES